MQTQEQQQLNRLEVLPKRQTVWMDGWTGVVCLCVLVLACARKQAQRSFTSSCCVQRERKGVRSVLRVRMSPCPVFPCSHVPVFGVRCSALFGSGWWSSRLRRFFVFLVFCFSLLFLGFRCFSLCRVGWVLGVASVLLFFGESVVRPLR